MSLTISDCEIIQIIKEMCEKSQNFQNFYRNEFPKLNGKKISWAYNPQLSVEGYADSRKYQIVIKKHPAKLLNEGNFFLICHEIGHLIQKEEKCPVIRFHPEFLHYLCPDSYTEKQKISALLNSMIYDFSINVKLKQYGIEGLSKILNPPTGKKSPAFMLTYIFRYVIFQRNISLFNETHSNEILECLQKYDNRHLIEIGDKILNIINLSNVTNAKGIIDLDKIKPIIKEISDNLKEFFPLPYAYKISVTQTGQEILIVPKEILNLSLH
jgi:hypothetical protein